ncbi:hypothetical protein C8C77_1484 [Halanaerobium saccharolyticum]|uniref:RES domain-containing protein n=1 Tax=Halanaerobium saccharolyticum TaxID=43595 RepID=A0A4R7YIT8_9FIRM|nr:hypothetical protein [Halanaerobium saccharolyticum]RAK03973.1 hypothetical protein C7958_1434 [Halanaerobium saccharolyticum]TDV97320.1 hypothetical protein C8C77_1484 [Halanaerobium saccharolyticum]TDX49092.1 hypothetical protein C7956_1474 [Halanaerobium saccharolyticum]
MDEVICLECTGLVEATKKLRNRNLIEVFNYDKEFDNLYGNRIKFDDEKDNEDENGVYQKCSCCSKKIYNEDYYIYKDKKNKFVEMILKILEKDIISKIDYCSKCEIGKDVEEINDLYKKKYKEKLFEGETIRDFLEMYKIPSNYFEYIIPNLECNNCNNKFKITDSSHEMKDLYLYSMNNKKFEELFYDINLEDLYPKMETYDIFIRDIEFNLFTELLSLYPMLGFKYRIGKKIYNLFKRMYENNDFIKLENKKLYRGRLNQKGASKFDENKMWNPSQGISTHGRYNIVGNPVLYCSDDKGIIPRELNYSDKHSLDIATIKIVNPLKILDLSNFMGNFGEYLSQSPKKNKKLHNEYLLTNYISECCKMIGYNGIKYKGVKDQDYNNYAILNFKKDIDLKIVKVEKAEVKIFYNL